MSRTETITRTLFTFDELNDKAKEKARDWWRVGESIDRADDEFENFADIAELLGITLRTQTVELVSGGTREEPCILYSGFSSQGDGACFEGSYAYRAGSVVSIKDHAPTDTALHEIAEALANVQYRHQNSIHATVKHVGPYYHEHSTEIEVFSDDEDRDVDPDAGVVRESLRDFMRWIYRQLEADYEYRMSDENVDESIQANRYEFTEDGKIA